jgi:pimeloyl-ACP methyl ester carboxylesterase
MIQPFFRELGTGPGVVCLHSNASSSSQWARLMERLAKDFHVIAPDLFGAGREPRWPTQGELTLSEEVAALEPVFKLAGDQFVLVGHSYGAAVALVAAVQQPERVRAMVLYEPTLVSLVDGQSQPPNEADGIRMAVEQAAASLARGDRTTAAKVFTDYWMGEGAWLARSDAQRDSIEASIGHLAAWSDALFGDPTPLAAFGELHVPVLLLVGTDTRAPARAVAGLLTKVLPCLELQELHGLGHMGPITDPLVVNEAIESFLRQRTGKSKH